MVCETIISNGKPAHECTRDDVSCRILYVSCGKYHLISSSVYFTLSIQRCRGLVLLFYLCTLRFPDLYYIHSGCAVAQSPARFLQWILYFLRTETSPRVFTSFWQKKTTSGGFWTLCDFMPGTISECLVSLLSFLSLSLIVCWFQFTPVVGFPLQLFVKCTKGSIPSSWGRSPSSWRRTWKASRWPCNQLS